MCECVCVRLSLCLVNVFVFFHWSLCICPHSLAVCVRMTWEQERKRMRRKRDKPGKNKLHLLCYFSIGFGCYLIIQFAKKCNATHTSHLQLTDYDDAVCGEAFSSSSRMGFCVNSGVHHYRTKWGEETNAYCFHSTIPPGCDGKIAN